MSGFFAASKAETGGYNSLAVDFITVIERCVAAVAERPMTYSAVYKDVRRIVANFPTDLNPLDY